MHKLLFTVAVVVVAFTELCEAVCKITDQITPVSLDFDEVAKRRYSVIYAATNDFSVTLDHVYIDWSKHGNNTYRSTNTIFKKDGTTIVKNSTVVYGNGIMQETFDDKDESGKEYFVTSYILATSSEGAILFYACNDHDSPEDLRFVIVPDGVILSEESLNQFLVVEKKFSFNGALFKLPNKL